MTRFLIPAFLSLPLLLTVACGDDATIDDDSTSSESASGGSTSQGGNGSGGDASGGNGSGGNGSGGGSAMHCPTVDLGSQLPINYDGTTVGKPNIVNSQRLEWETAGDDALLFTAPSAGTYTLSFTSPAGGCGASIREYGPNMNGMGDIYDTSWCPMPGEIATIDGVYAATDVVLAAGQEMLVWVSCAYFSNPLESPYNLTITVE